MDTVLELRHVNKSFSTVQVLKDINCCLRKGTILGLVGENGAGKSTLMNILGGVYVKTSGEFYLDGKPYEPQTPDDAIKEGIAFIHQELNLFTNLSVAENIFLDQKKKGTFGIVSMSKLNAAAKKLLDRIDMDINPRTLVKDLPMGMRQMVEIAKAIAKNAKIIFFDEPTTSLSSKEKDTLFSLIRSLAQQGVSMIYISHALDDVLSLCDEVLVLRDGQVIGEQKPVGKVTKDELITMMVGREISQLFPYVEKQVGEEVIRVEHLTQGNRVQDVSFNLHAGEITGVFGLMGAGRSELAHALYGITGFDSGSIYVRGEPMKKLSPRKWIAQGMAYITENRRDDGLLMPKSVQENLVLASLDRMQSGMGRLDVQAMNAACKKSLSELNIKTHDLSRQVVNSLSGGNQQKVVIGKWLMVAPKIFIIDEPTRGIDVGAKHEIYNKMNELVQGGSAILFISSEIEELMGICDRVLVMAKGRIVGEIPRCEFSQEKFLQFAIGGNANE